jgi:hypothetical protein
MLPFWGLRVARGYQSVVLDGIAAVSLSTVTLFSVLASSIWEGYGPKYIAHEMCSVPYPAAFGLKIMSRIDGR